MSVEGESPPPPRPVRRERFTAPPPSAWLDARPVILLFLVLLAVSAAAIVVSSSLESDSPTILLAASAIDAVVILAFCTADRRRIRPLLARVALGPRNLLRCVVALILVFGTIQIWFAALSWLEIDSLRYLDSFRDHGWPIWTAFAMISIYPAVFEELCFRGYIQGRLQSILGSGEALALQAVLFSVVHLSPLIFPTHFVMGLILGWLRNRTGSLYPGMVVHALWNASVLVMEIYRPES
jgi:membrane protease YdiL (CAAX protease family)